MWKTTLPVDLPREPGDESSASDHHDFADFLFADFLFADFNTTITKAEGGNFEIHRHRRQASSHKAVISKTWPPTQRHRFRGQARSHSWIFIYQGECNLPWQKQRF
ncbi:hypothetical protein B5P22_31330 [Pseudomonas tolaasii]|nr:hypothetical protein B5P22_31330 [Pseudomonas tolaasii]